MKSAAIGALVLVTALAACDEAPTNNGPTSVQSTSSAQTAELSAQTDSAELVDACIRFVTQGFQRDLGTLGYTQSTVNRGTRFKKEIPDAFFAMGNKIRRINVQYTTGRRGDRLCQIDHDGAGRNSGTGALLSEFVSRMQADGWVITRPNRLSKDGRNISFRGQVRISNGVSRSELNFGASPP
jgi:hypothetical protein